MQTPKFEGNAEAVFESLSAMVISIVLFVLLQYYGLMLKCVDRVVMYFNSRYFYKANGFACLLWEVDIII